MEFDAPANASQWDTSCATTIEVRAIGTQYPYEPGDYKSTVLQLPTAAPTYDAVLEVLRDHVTLAIPDSGLAGISVMGWSVPPNWTQPTGNAWYPTPELTFFAHDNYIGQDVITLQAVPNVNCKKQPVAVRVVDMFALVAAGSSASCSTAMTYTNGVGWSGTGTLVPRLFEPGVDFFGAQSFASGSDSLAQFSAETQVGPKSCLALIGSDDTGTSTGCAIPGPAVCAGGAELEIAATNYTATGDADPMLSKTMPGVVFGSVWTGAATRTPIAGATVQVDPNHARVVYIDPQANGHFSVRGNQSGTGPSGMFVLYADAIVEATIKSGSKTRTVALGASQHSSAGAMIVLP